MRVFSMMIAQMLLIFLLGCENSHNSWNPTIHQVFSGKASYVIDGRTFYFSFDHGKVKVRLANLNTPEISDKNGFESYEFLRKAIHQKTVQVEFLSLDSQNRWMANVRLENGDSLQQKVVEKGFGTAIDKL